MKKNILTIFQFLTAVIVILLALSTFFIQQFDSANYSENPLIRILCLDHFYTSWLNAGLFSLLGLLIFLSLIFGRLKTRSQQLLHIIILCSFVVIMFDKIFNQRTMVPFPEKETVEFSDIINDPESDHTIVLDKFEVNMHSGSSMPKAFVSHLIINEMDTVRLEVNKPVRIGNYNLYQNAYDRVPVYDLKIKDYKYQISPFDTLSVDGHKLWLELSENYKEMTFHFNEQQQVLSARGGSFKMVDFPVNIQMDGMKYVSIIEIAQVRGMGVLLILGIGYLVSLAVCFWGRK